MNVEVFVDNPSAGVKKPHEIYAIWKSTLSLANVNRVIPAHTPCAHAFLWQKSTMEEISNVFLTKFLEQFTSVIC